MRLFYDSYTTRTRAELTLVAADMLAMVAVALYLVPAFLGDARVLDKALLVVWAATPRALARILTALDHPTGFVKLLAAATTAVVLIAALLGAGWDLIHTVSPPGFAPTPLGLGMLFCAWGAGFLVCQPGAYRLFDFFLGGALLVGLKDGAPQPYIWIPVFFLAICLSGTVRHLIHDVFDGRRNPPINLQNARVVALLGAGAMTFAFLAICLALGGGRFPAPTPGIDDRGRWFTRTRFATWRDDSRDRWREGDPWRDGAPAGPDAASRTGDAPRGAGDSGEEPGRQIGFTQHVRLGDLTRPEMESVVVLRVGARPDTPAGREWRPSGSVLWKGITLATYDATTQSWTQPMLTEEASWPTRLPREIPADLASRDTVTLLHTVVNPVFESFITPYFTSEISTEDGTSRVLTYVRALPGDDIFPRPALEPYSTYATRVAMVGANHVPDIRPADIRPGGADTTVDPRYLAIPPAGDLGIDIRAEARAIFQRESSARSRLESLRRYFQDSFQYAVEEDWTGGVSPLSEFLIRNRRGDCTYFATAAALLLRATDLPTRFVVGFSGGEWDAATNEVVVRNGRAHGWIEVHIQGTGWYPVDATLWVAPNDSVVAPRDLPLEVLRDATRDADEGMDTAPTDPDGLVDGASPLAQDPTAPDGSVAADGAPGNDAPAVAPLRPLGEHDSLAMPGVVKGLRSFVRTEPAGAAFPEDEHRTLVTGVEVLRGKGPAGDESSEPAPASPRRPLLSGNVRVVLRAMFLLLSIIVLGMLIYVYVRPPRKKKDGDAGETEDDEESFHLPAEATTELSPVFDRTDPRERVLAAYHQLQSSLRATRNHRRPHQTPLEHAWSLGEKPPETEESFRRVHIVLYRVLYGGQEVDDEEALRIERHCQRIRRLLG